MALDLWVYGDESGKKESKFSLVSAYIGNARTWDILRKEWEAVLAPMGLSELHAVDLFTRKFAREGGSSENPHASWSDERAAVFISQIVSIIRCHRRSIRPIEAIVDVEAFKALPYGERRALTSGRFNFWEHTQHRKWASDGKPSEPYMLAFQVVVQSALKMCPPTAKVHFVFDINKDVTSAVARLTAEVVDLKWWPEYERLVKDVEFKDSAEFPGIQMADLRGFLLNRYVRLGQYRIGPEQLWALSRIGRMTVRYQILGAKELEKTLAYNLMPEHRAWLRAQA